MSVLIRGLNMPKDDYSCVAVFLYKNGAQAHGKLYEAKELPDHGDWIDRKELMREFADFVRASNNSDFAQVPNWNDAVSLVGSMPVVIPAEEKI